MSDVIRHGAGYTLRSPAHWMPIEWHTWDDYNAMPANVPQRVWTDHRGHNAQMRQSAFGVHALHCTDCRFWWSETSTEDPVTPTIGRIVIYKSKIDNGPGNDVLSPAIIIRTRDTTVPAVVERWGPEPRTVVSASDPTVTHETTARPEGLVPELPDDDTVDLLVFGLGKNYREYAVRCGDGLGQWSWPPRV